VLCCAAAAQGLGAATKDDGNGVGSAALEARRAMKVRDAQSRSKAPKRVQPLDLEDGTPQVQLLTDKHLQKANRRLEKSVQHAADNAEVRPPPPPPPAGEGAGVGGPPPADGRSAPRRGGSPVL
jgi:hypothetical protein